MYFDKRAAWLSRLPSNHAANSRTQARKRSITGLRVRFFTVTIPAEYGFEGKSTGSATTCNGRQSLLQNYQPALAAFDFAEGKLAQDGRN